MSTLGVWDRTGDQQVRDSLVGNGRSVASTQLAQGQRAIQNAAYSQAASQRGGNPALAVRNAQHAAAIAGAENNYNQAKLRAQEQLQYQQVAQAEDEKRGKFIGGILGGTGALIGSLGGPAGTVAGGALGAAAGNLIGGNSEGALQAGLQTGLGAAVPKAAAPQLPVAAGRRALGVGGLSSTLPIAPAYVPQMQANTAADKAIMMGQGVGDTGIADDMAGGTSMGLNRLGSLQELPTGPAPTYAAPAAPVGAFPERQAPAISQTMPVATPPAVVQSNAPNGMLPTPSPLSLTLPVNTSGYGSLSGNQSFPRYMQDMPYDQWAAERGHAGRMRLGRRLY